MMLKLEFFPRVLSKIVASNRQTERCYSTGRPSPISVSRPLTVQNHNPAALPRYADWWIRIDAHTFNAEKALLWFSGSPFSIFRKMKLKFGEGMGTSLIDRMLVF